MRFEQIPYEKVARWSKRDLAFIQRDAALADFVGSWASLDAFGKQIDKKSKDTIDRKLLVEVLNEQYSLVNKSRQVSDQIDALDSQNTFTVVTAHQPSLMTGPLYYIFKICSAINLSKKLKATFPKYNFVPLFISGGEDHDLDEINHFQLYGKDVVWERAQEGSVSRMSTDGIDQVIADTFEILSKNESAEKLKIALDKAYATSKNYGEFQFNLVHELFSDFGLIFLNMDHPKLKQAFVAYMEKELFTNLSHEHVNKTIAQLNDAGFKSQASPREINLFYLGKDYRSRIIENGNGYQVVDQELSFSKEELKRELNDHPERFSPNVVMRPIYQEAILPNLAYVGGGGEIAYWTERKTQFEAFNLTFPLLIRRNSGMIINSGIQKQMDQLGFGLDEIFNETHTLEKLFLEQNPDAEVDFSTEINHIEDQLNIIADKAKDIDPTLEKAANAELTKIMKGLDHLTNKIVKAEKRKHEVAINKIHKVHTKLFPGNGLQERKENFLPYYIQYGPELIENLIENLDPLERKFTVVHLE